MELDLEFLAALSEWPMNKKCGDYLGEPVKAPFMVFAWVVARKISGGDIGDCFGVDAYNLCQISLDDWRRVMDIMPSAAELPRVILALEP